MVNEKSNSKDLFSFKNICIGLVIVLMIPIPISLVITVGNWLSFFDGSSSIWIGFWGSYLGGIIGTAGVIYVAHLQNKEQRDSMTTIEENNMKRLLMQTLLDLSIDYSKNLNNFSMKLTNIQSKVSKIVKYSIELEKLRANNNDRQKIDYKERHVDYLRDELIRLNIPSGFVTNSLANLEYQNLVLSNKDFKLEEKLKGKEGLYFDKVIDCLTSSDYTNQKFYKLYLETQRDKDKDFGKVSKWLLKERTNISQNSTDLLEKLK